MENKEFVSYKESLDMKELGFDEECYGVVYPDDQVNVGDTLFVGIMLRRDSECIPSPLYQQAFRWFREKHKLMCWPEPNGSWCYNCRYRGIDSDNKQWVGYLRDEGEILSFESHKEAELECLRKLIKIVKNGK